MGKFFKINVLSIQLKKEMQALASITPILSAIIAMMLYTSFEAFVQGFQFMDKKAPETQKVHLILAPTGSGKTTLFLAEMVRKYPDVLFVLCLPRVLACNVATYLRSEYGLDVCVKNGRCRETPTGRTEVLIMTYQSAVNAVVSGKINEYARGRQVSLIFDECHETCSQATLLFGVMTALFSKRPKFLHSLICVSATMHTEELSKRLGGIDPSRIQVSEIEAPAKSFEKGPTFVIPISVGILEEEEQEQEQEQDPFHVLFREYCSKFEDCVVQIIEQSGIQLNTSSVVICAGIKTANNIENRLSTTLVKGQNQPVVIWNTFVQHECPIKDSDLPSYHLIIIGSHMKLSSSITFRRCGSLFICKVMQVATPNLTNSTTVLNLGIVPESVEKQSIGRGNRDFPTEVFQFPIIFPVGVVHPPRLNYPLQEAVPPFMVEFVDSTISGSSPKITTFLEKYKMSKATATTLFYAHAPIELLLAIHSYSRIEVSKENKKFFELSINLLRAFTQACAYISNGAFQIRRNQETVRNDTEFARLLGFFLLDVVNRIIDAPLTRSDKDWNTFFQQDVDIQNGVYEITQLILGDGLGKFSFNGKPKTVTPQFLSRVIDFTRLSEPRIAPFFMKLCTKMYVMKPDDTGKPTIGESKFCGPVLLPFGTIITGAGDPLFPMFFLEIPPVVVEKEVDGLSAGGGSAVPVQVIPTSRPYASGGGSAVPAQVRPSQRLSASGGGSASDLEFQKFVEQFQDPDVIKNLNHLMNCIPSNLEFTPASFLNPTKYPNGALPENVRTFQTELKAVNKQYSLLTFLQELGLMRINLKGKYERNL